MSRPISVAAHQFGRELDDEFTRMCNEWFFPWHHISSESGMEVDDFNGRKVRYAGLAFYGSPVLVYWSTLDRYSRKQVAESFVRIEQIVAAETQDPERELVWLSNKVQELINRIVQEAVKVSSRISKAEPSSRPFEADQIAVRAKADILRLTQAIELRSVAPRKTYLARLLTWFVQPDFVGKVILALFGAVLGFSFSLLIKG